METRIYFRNLRMILVWSPRGKLKLKTRAKLLVQHTVNFSQAKTKRSWEKNSEESKGQSFQGFDREKCHFYWFGNFPRSAFAIFGEVEQQIK